MPLACGLEIILIAKVIALILGALGVTKVATSEREVLGDQATTEG